MCKHKKTAIAIVCFLVVCLVAGCSFSYIIDMPLDIACEESGESYNKDILPEYMECEIIAVPETQTAEQVLAQDDNYYIAESIGGPDECCRVHVAIFHLLDPFVFDVVPEEIFNDWYLATRALEEQSGECLVNLLTLIEHFNITREVFQELIDSNIWFYFWWGGNTLDVLYSGDKALIQQFFSRENITLISQLISEREITHWSERVRSSQQRVSENTIEMSWYFHDIWTWSFLSDDRGWYYRMWMRDLVESGEYDRVNLIEFINHFGLYRESSLSPGMSIFEHWATHDNLNIFTHYNFEVLLSGNMARIRAYYAIENEATHTAQVQARFQQYVATHGYTPDTSWMIDREGPIPTPTPPPTSTPIHTGTLTTAPWRIYPDGTLAISPGSITWPAAQSPWHNYREIITQVVIEGPITAGPSLRGLFAHLANVTEITGLNYLDTTAVTNMRGMFNGARSLAHLDVSTWDTSNVTDMEALFHDTAITTLDVSGWDISRVTTMNRMFQRTPNLTALDVSRWDTGNVTDMTGVFDGATSLTALDISNWDTSNVVQMRRMFTDTRGIATLDVSRWDVGSVETMEGMFSGAGVTALDLSRWDTGNVRSMSTMFTDTAIASLDLSSWNTANVTTMNRMFQRMANLETLNISGFDTGNVRDMFQMFSNASALRLLSLGESFRFVENGGAIMLRAGIWGNVGGVYTLTTPELMMRHNASPALETWIIQ